MAASPTIEPKDVETATTVETAHEPAAEAGLLGTLGIEGKLFAAQLVNFTIVAVVLWKFAYKPLLKVMDERAATIAKGLKDAEDAGAAKKLADEATAAAIAEARAKAKEIVDDATKRAEAERSAVAAKTKEEVAKIVAQGKEQIAAEKAKMVAEAKAEVGSLIALATERVLREKVDAQKDARIIAAAIADAEKV